MSTLKQILISVLILVCSAVAQVSDVKNLITGGRPGFPHYAVIDDPLNVWISCSKPAVPLWSDSATSLPIVEANRALMIQAGWKVFNCSETPVKLNTTSRVVISGSETAGVYASTTKRTFPSTFVSSATGSSSAVSSSFDVCITPNFDEFVVMWNSTDVSAYALTFATSISVESTISIANNTLLSSPDAVCFKTSLESAVQFTSTTIPSISVWPRGAIRSQRQTYSVALSQFRSTATSAARVYFALASSGSATISYRSVVSPNRPLILSSFDSSTFLQITSNTMTPASVTIDDGGEAGWLLVDIPANRVIMLSGDNMTENFITLNTQPWDSTLIVSDGPAGFPDSSVRAIPISLPSSRTFNLMISCSPSKLDVSFTSLRFMFGFSNASIIAPASVNFSMSLTVSTTSTFISQSITTPSDALRLHYYVSSQRATDAKGTCQINVIADPQIDVGSHMNSITPTSLANFSTAPSYEIILESSAPVCLSGAWSRSVPLVFGTDSPGVLIARLAPSGISGSSVVSALHAYEVDLFSPVWVYSTNATQASPIRVFASPQFQSVALNDNSTPPQTYRLWDLWSLYSTEQQMQQVIVRNEGTSSRIESISLPSGNVTLDFSSFNGETIDVTIPIGDNFLLTQSNGVSPQNFVNSRQFTSFSAGSSFGVTPGVYCFLGFKSFATTGLISADFSLTQVTPSNASATITASIANISSLPVFPSMWSSDNLNLSIRARVFGRPSLCLEFSDSFTNGIVTINNFIRDFTTTWTDSTGASNITENKCPSPRSYNPFMIRPLPSNYSCNGGILRIRYAKVVMDHSSSQSVLACSSQGAGPLNEALVSTGLAPQIALLNSVCAGCATASGSQIVSRSQIRVSGIISFVSTDDDLSTFLAKLAQGPSTLEFGTSYSISSVELCSNQDCGGLDSPTCTTDDLSSSSLVAHFLSLCLPLFLCLI